jgi:hypothetical protein
MLRIESAHGAEGDLCRGKGHLPPGHEPCPQSRRGARGRQLGMGLLVLLVVGFLAGAIVLLIIAPHAKSPSGARVARGDKRAAADARARIPRLDQRLSHDHALDRASRSHGLGVACQVEKFGPDVHCWHLLSVPAPARVHAA